jgi:hypothetical protein
MIMRDHAELRRERGHLPGPEATLSAEPRHQQQWFALAALLEEELGISNRNLGHLE